MRGTPWHFLARRCVGAGGNRFASGLTSPRAATNITEDSDSTQAQSETLAAGFRLNIPTSIDIHRTHIDSQNDKTTGSYKMKTKTSDSSKRFGLFSDALSNT
jgi:hypothetical protein